MHTVGWVGQSNEASIAGSWAMYGQANTESQVPKECKVGARINIVKLGQQSQGPNAE